MLLAFLTASLSASACAVTDPTCLEAACGFLCMTCEYAVGPDDDPAGCYWKPPLAGGCECYWSRSVVADDTGDAWRVDFTNAGLYAAPMDTDTEHAGFVRCVKH